MHYVPQNGLKFRPAYDDGNVAYKGFLIDDLEMKIYNNATPSNILYSYSTSFERTLGGTLIFVY